MTVNISPNIQKESARINVRGDIIDPKTKQVLQENRPDPLPPAPVPDDIDTGKSNFDVAHAAKAFAASSGSSELDARIEAKVQKYRQDLIEKAKAALDNL